MKVPHSYVGRTRTPSQSLGYLDPSADPGAFGGNIARGISTLGAAIGVKMTQLKEREDKSDRFQSLTNFSDFTSQASESLMELKRNSAPDGKGFAAAADAEYKKQEQLFLNNSVTPELREEFAYRSNEVRNKILLDATDFQYKQGDAHFREGVNTEYQKMLKSVDPKLGGSAQQLKAAKAHMAEVIGTTDLSTIEQASLVQTMSIGLEGVAYYQAVKEMTSKGLKGDQLDIIRSEESFRATPYWDVNHLRVGYGSDTITHADGSFEEVKAGMTVTREDAERDLARRSKGFANTAAGQIGAENWGALSGNAKAALTSVAYNYGSLPPSVVAAAKGGDTAALARAVGGLSSNPQRRQREAQMISGGGGQWVNPDENPDYANVPYETRVAAHADVDAELKRDQAAQEQAAKDVYNTQYNSLLNGANDGTINRQHVEDAREEGWLTDASDIMRVQGVIDKRDEDARLAGLVTNTLATPYSIWDPTDEDGKKAYNLWLGNGGKQAIANMDAGYIQNTLFPAIGKLHDIPTDAIGQLMGMMRSKQNAQMLFASETLKQMEGIDGDAYRDRVPDELEKQVEVYRRYQDTGVPLEQILERMNVSDTPEGRRVDAELRKEAQTHLAQEKGGVTTLNTLLTGALEGFANWQSVHLNAVPSFAREFQHDYQVHFEDGYAMFGNAEEADAYAQKQLPKTWAVTAIGGTNTVMKFPPERAGYKPLSGSYDWMSRQVREEFKLTPDQNFEFLSDATTEKEYSAYKMNPSAPLPTYQVVKIDADGAYHFSNTDPRYRGKPQAFDLLEDQNATVKKDLAETMIQKENELNRAKLFYRNRDQELPPEFQDEYDAAKQAYEGVRPAGKEFGPNMRDMYPYGMAQFRRLN